MNREIKTDANNPNAWYTKGLILFKMGRYQDVRNSFAQAADIDPEFAEAWYNKGREDVQGRDQHRHYLFYQPLDAILPYEIHPETSYFVQ